MSEDIKKDSNLNNDTDANENELNINDLDNVNGGAVRPPADPNHRR